MRILALNMRRLVILEGPSQWGTSACPVLVSRYRCEVFFCRRKLIEQTRFLPFYHAGCSNVPEPSLLSPIS
ncbi:hypothetical protein V6N12_066691 [Hibiscus sabdariffa]|uniref:Secreted protein n=1 Tax=Hibiscus sabdariffa TaxID=183260 RepID=A0ABR2BDF5_9ROSI